MMLPPEEQRDLQITVVPIEGLTAVTKQIAVLTDEPGSSSHDIAIQVDFPLPPENHHAPVTATTGE